jgi:hypothetical protein
MKKKEINERIARFVGKSPFTIRDWETHHPELYELVSIGVFCKVNELDEDRIKKLIELQELIKGKE